MAVELTATDYSGTGTGAAATYGTGIYANASDQIKVYIDGALQTIGDDYSLSGIGSAGGVDVLGTFTLGSAVYVERVTPITQLVDTQNNETILEDVLDAEFDKLTMIAQEIGGKAGRALLFPKGEAGYTLPAPAARASKFIYFDALGNPLLSAGSGVSDGLRAELAGRLVGQGGDLVGLRDSGAPAGSVFTTLQGMVDKLRSAAYGGGIIPYGSDQTYPAGTVGNELTPRVTLAGLANVPPQAGKVVFVHDDYKEGFFRWKSGNFTTQVAADPYQGIYRPSTVAGFGVTVGCWVRLWDWITALPEWFGVIPNSSADAAANDLRIAACYALAPHTQFGPNDYWTTTTIKANIENHWILGISEKYTGVNTAVTRIVCTSGSVPILQMGPDAYPGSIGAMPQNIRVQNIYLGRSVAPVIASNCPGLLQQFTLFSIAENVKTDGSMVGGRSYGNVHSFLINCEFVRASAGTGGGTDYYIGHYADGGSGLFAGGNASLYIINCSAGCNYGPLQTATGSKGFWADQGFTDVWYWNPETVNFYWAQMVSGNDSAALVFSNTDFTIFHPIHDQFHNAGIYVNDVAAAGSVAIEDPYYGPGSGARAAYWVNSGEGAVASRGGQFVMGANASCQAILLMSSRGTDVLGYPQILEHGNTWPIVGVADVNDARIEVFAKNPTVTAAAFVQVSGTCVNVTGAVKSSGKNGAFQYGYQLIGTNIRRCTFDVSGLNSANFPAVNRQLDNNGTPITAAGVFAIDCLGQGNFA